MTLTDTTKVTMPIDSSQPIYPNYTLVPPLYLAPFQSSAQVNIYPKWRCDLGSYDQGHDAN